MSVSGPPISPENTFKNRLARATALVSTVALGIASLALIGYHVAASRNAIARSLVVQADTIALNSVSAIDFDDDRSAEEALGALRADRNIISASIYKVDGALFAGYASQSAAREQLAPMIAVDQQEATRFRFRTAEVYRVIVSDGKRRGTIHLVYSLNDLFADLARYFGIIIIGIGISLFGARLAAMRLQQSFADPIARLASAAGVVSRTKDYSIRVTPTGTRDEIGLLVDTFNEMLGEIQLGMTEVEASRAQVQRLNQELEIRVMQRTAELNATNKELEAFTYSVSHDLRAPLRRIDGFANLLADKSGSTLGEEGRHFLVRIREGTRQMGNLIDDLLNLARLGRKDVSLRRTDLSPIVSRVAASLSRESDGRVIDWKLQPLPALECDPALIEVVLTNLMSNAVKYTRTRERAIIEVGATRSENGSPIVFVRDNGVGFSMKYAHKLFGAFQRLHRAEDFEGTGIGLATVQRIVHKHHGAVWAESEVDAGASFYFTVGSSPRVGADGL